MPGRVWKAGLSLVSGVLVQRCQGQDAAAAAAATPAAAECAVPTVEGASVTGCAEGATVADATACTWAAEDGYTCENSGEVTCANGAFPTTPVCHLKCTITEVIGASLSRLAGDDDENNCLEGKSIGHGKKCTWATDASHTCDQEGEAECAEGVWSLTPVCKAKCPVPSVDGATVAGDGCTAGELVTDTTVCTWTAVADTGKTCNNMDAPLTCTNGRFSLTPFCLGPASADLLANAQTMEGEAAKLEQFVRTAEGSVHDLNVAVGSLADELTKAAKLASETGEMARGNAAAGRAFAADKHRVDVAMANLSTQVNHAENLTLEVQGSVPADFDFSKVSAQLVKLQKANKTFEILQNTAADADSLAAMGQQIADFQKKVNEAVNKSLEQVNMTALMENRTIAFRKYGRNLFLNESRRLKSAADAKDGAAEDWARLYAPPQRRKHLRHRVLHGFGCGDCGQP